MGVAMPETFGGLPETPLLLEEMTHFLLGLSSDPSEAASEKVNDAESVHRSDQSVEGWRVG